MKGIAYCTVITLLLVSCMPLIDSPISTHPSTPVPILKATRTPAPMASPTPLPTVNEIEPAMGFVQKNCVTSGLGAKTSPDSEWLASSCIDEDNAHVRIARFDGAQAWDLYFEDITGWPPCLSYNNQYGEMACIGGILYIDHWHKDGRYVFVTADYQIDRSTNFSFGLYRIDSQIGRSSAYLPVNGTGYNYAFSPNDEAYAYVTGNDNYLLHVVSIETGQDSTFTVPGRYADLGDLTWSPDSSRLILVSRGIGWGDDDTVGFSLLMLDTQTKEFTTLLSNDARRFHPIEWLSNDRLLLGGFSVDRGEYIKYQLTISTGVLTPLSSITPSP